MSTGNKDVKNILKGDYSDHVWYKKIGEKNFIKDKR